MDRGQKVAARIYYGRPRMALNGAGRIRKPLLFPLSYGGIQTSTRFASSPYAIIPQRAPHRPERRDAESGSVGLPNVAALCHGPGERVGAHAFEDLSGLVIHSVLLPAVGRSDDGANGPKARHRHRWSAR